MKNIVYFDLETQRSIRDVGGDDFIRNLGISIGVSYSTLTGEYRIYSEKQVPLLIEELKQADLVIGYNILRFDYVVLQGYDDFFDYEQLPTLDLMEDLRKTLQFRLGLDSVASASLGLEKTSDGLQALKWFKEGKFMEIAEYCCYDVKITKLVHEFGMSAGQIFFRNRMGLLQAVPVNWK